MNLRSFLLPLALSLSLGASAALAQSAPVALTLTLPASIDTKPVPDEFTGLSFEMELLRPRADGTFYFRPDNQPLLTLFKTLGIRSLRIGGNTADRPTVPFPTPAEIDRLFAFAKKADVKVIFTLRLREGDPRQAAAVAKHIVDHHADLLWCFSIGNEPNVFAPEYPQFFSAWTTFADTVNSPEFAPKARFAGPSSTAGKTAWTRDFAKQLNGTGRLLIATQHIYPGGNSDLVKDPAEGRRLLLSREWVDGYQKFHDSFVPEVLATGTPYRLVETNSFWNGGRKDASNTFAAALWALDYLHWWAAHGANGINFHTGDFVAKAEENTRSMYSAFWTTERGYEAKPVAYALKAFDLVRHGKIAALTEGSGAKDLNLTAYAIEAADATYVTLINKTYGPDARPAEIALTTRPGAKVQSVPLITSDADVARTTGFMLGGGTIQEDGTWSGRWTPAASADKDGRLVVQVPAASALLLKLPRL